MLSEYLNLKLNFKHDDQRTYDNYNNSEVTLHNTSDYTTHFTR